MKKLLLVFLISLTSCFAFGQQWMWVNHAIGHTSNDSMDPLQIGIDSKGNTFSTGLIGGKVTFDGKITTNVPVSSEYLVKYSPVGKVLWVKTAQSVSSSVSWSGGTSISTDLNGNIYVDGRYAYEVNIDTFHLMYGNPDSYGGGNDFIVKYDSTGKVIWARDAITGLDVIKNCTILNDSKGYVYTVGMGNYNYISGNDTIIPGNLYIVKYDPNGNILWIRGTSTPSAASFCFTSNAAIDGADNIYVGGNFRDTIFFGKNEMITNKYGNYFLAKYDSSGKVVWVNSPSAKTVTGVMGGSNAFYIASDKKNGIFVSGYMADSINFGIGGWLYGNSSFLIKYDSLGNIQWLLPGKEASSKSGIGIKQLTANGSGDVFLFGGIQDTVSFAGQNFINNQGSDFYMEINSQGIIICESFFDCDNEDGIGIIADNQGPNLYFTADIDKTTTFGTFVLYETGNEDGIMTKWTCDSYESINEISGGNNSSLVYPNPSNGIFNLQLVPMAIGKEQVEVYNMLGEQVFHSQYSIPTTQYKINISNQPAGLYLYRITSEKGEAIATGKLILQ